MLSVPLATLTVPLLLNARLVVLATPVPAATVRVPPLVKWSGDTQQLPALTVVPGPMVRVPRLLRVVVPFSLTSPVPFRAVVPWRVRAVGVVAGEVRLLRAVPLIVVAMPLATLR